MTYVDSVETLPQHHDESRVRKRINTVLRYPFVYRLLPLCVTCPHSHQLSFVFWTDVLRIYTEKLCHFLLLK
jgi:hypothetical protein